MRTKSGGGGRPIITSDAILEPGEKIKMPYRLYDSGTLEFFPAPDGQPLGNSTKLYIDDTGFYPSTAFTPPGREFVTYRSNWKTETTHEEVWLPAHLWVRRELDGWDVPASDEYKSRYGDPNADDRGSDYAIFTIEVRSL